jgi:hypothetical protein
VISAKWALTLLLGETSAEHEWFTMMVRTHITEWWEGGPSVITAARQVKVT